MAGSPARCDVEVHIAASTALADHRLAVTSDIPASRRPAAMQEGLRVEAKVIKVGKRICRFEARGTEAEGKLVAVSRVTESVIAYPKMKDLLKKG